MCPCYNQLKTLSVLHKSSLGIIFLVLRHTVMFCRPCHKTPLDLLGQRWQTDACSLPPFAFISFLQCYLYNVTTKAAFSWDKESFCVNWFSFFLLMWFWAVPIHFDWYKEEHKWLSIMETSIGLCNYVCKERRAGHAKPPRLCSCLQSVFIHICCKQSLASFPGLS